MPPLPVLLLPGLDGTGDLFAPLVAAAPPEVRPIVVRLPETGSYDEIFDAIREQIPNERFAVIGESFSGPLALRVAREAGDRVVAVILCNSVLVPPITPLLRFVPWTLLFAVRPPRWVIRRFFVGRDAPPELVSAVQRAIAKTPRRILAARMRAVFTLPKSPPHVDAPVLCLRGTEDRMVAQKLPFARKEIAGPHLLLQARPVEAWNAITALLSDSRPASSPAE
ncbi:MAG TPA: alpha/beta fold hydrolase [Vicinamibacterales bacterium]|nr:alpha/beta fold hydrolase [Vicinamibacterales bacterium]